MAAKTNTANTTTKFTVMEKYCHSWPIVRDCVKFGFWIGLLFISALVAVAYANSWMVGLPWGLERMDGIAINFLAVPLVSAGVTGVIAIAFIPFTSSGYLRNQLQNGWVDWERNFPIFVSPLWFVPKLWVWAKSLRS